jgi:hypothetical protein
MPDLDEIENEHVRAIAATLLEKYPDNTPGEIVVIEEAVAHFERPMRELEFLLALADGGAITVHGIPWREAFDRLNAIVSDPV